MEFETVERPTKVKSDGEMIEVRDISECVKDGVVYVLSVDRYGKEEKKYFYYYSHNNIRYQIKLEESYMDSRYNASVTSQVCDRLEDEKGDVVVCDIYLGFGFPNDRGGYLFAHHLRKILSVLNKNNKLISVINFTFIREGFTLEDFKKIRRDLVEKLNQVGYIKTQDYESPEKVFTEYLYYSQTGVIDPDAELLKKIKQIQTPVDSDEYVKKRREVYKFLLAKEFKDELAGKNPQMEILEDGMGDIEFLVN
jgi:hypothetical protein